MNSGWFSSEQFVRQLSDKEFRDEFVADQVRTTIALMIRALREQEDRKWSQTELGERTGTTQSVISRIEDPDYGRLSLQTLLDVAAAFDLPLIVDIPEWDDWFRRTPDVSKAALHRTSFNEDRLIEQIHDYEDGITEGKISNLFDPGNQPSNEDPGAKPDDATITATSGGPLALEA